MKDSRLLGRTDIERLLEEHGLAPRKSLGQNFVVDPNIINRIVRLAQITEGECILEIGPGLGSLTIALEQTGAQVLALEIDSGLASVVRSAVGESVTILEQDAMTADIEQLLQDATSTTADGCSDWVLVANLPYNVATPLVITMLEAAPSIKRMLIMVQREVAERFVAQRSTKEYGAVSVRIAYFATARIVGHLPPEVFYPRPHIESSLVEITRRDGFAVDPSICSYTNISNLVRAGFSQRRKMLRRSLAGMVNDEAYSCADVAPTLRAENLDVVTWGKLAGCQRAISNSQTPS